MTTLLSATTALGSAAATMTLCKSWNVQNLSQRFSELSKSTCCVLSTCWSYILQHYTLLTLRGLVAH